MISLTYTGPAGRRVLGKEDGLSSEIDVRRGESIDVSKKDADRLAEIGGFEETSSPPSAASDTDPAGSVDATSPNEGS